MMGSSQDYFWAVSLNDTSKEHKWEPDALKENGDVGLSNMSLSIKGEHSLIVKQAVLGADAKDEIHVVEVETAGYKGSTVSVPILRLAKGEKSSMLLDLNFPDPPVMFKLTKGSGPIHISGNHIINQEPYTEDEEDELDEQESDEEEEDLEEEELKEEKKSETTKKRGSSNAASSPAKKKKKNDA